MSGLPRQYGPIFDRYKTSEAARQPYGAGAADVACVLFAGSEATFLLVFEDGDRAAVAGEVEKAGREGRRFDRERRALADGLKGINFVAIMENPALHRKLELYLVVEDQSRQGNCIL